MSPAVTIVVILICLTIFFVVVTFYGCSQVNNIATRLFAAKRANDESSAA